MSRSPPCISGIIVTLLTSLPASAASPSFDCDKVDGSSIESLICSDDELAVLDRRLAETYAAARRKAVRQHPRLLQTEQSGWIKGRNNCWKSRDLRQCTLDNYRLRIAELQARYGLVPHTGPTIYMCDGAPTNQVVVSWFDTDPPTLIAERGDDVSLMYLQPSASGSRYIGRNESLWEWHGEATITWGYQTPARRCVVRP